MKTVSFEVAKAIKEAGYPQVGYYWYSPQGVECYSESDLDEVGYVSAPTYLQVWLWLWREKKICLFNVGTIENKAIIDIVLDGVYQHTTTSYSDPEEAIIEAIEYLVENDLIK